MRRSACGKLDVDPLPWTITALKVVREEEPRCSRA
jgi:hypothetical protein